MKHWQETSHILSRVAEFAAAGRSAALATVVRIEGSAYRRPGAKLLVEEGGATRGGVSGGCLEADVREIGMAVMRDGAPRLRHYETGDDDRTVWGLGLGCNGAVDVFVQPVTAPDALDAARRVRALLAGDAPFAVSTVVRGPSAVLGRMLVTPDGPPAGATGAPGPDDRIARRAEEGRAAVGSQPVLLNLDGGIARRAEEGRAAVRRQPVAPDLDREVARRAEVLLAVGESKCHDVESAGVFTEVHVPPPRLVICGAGDDAMPLSACAAQVGFRVTVVDHRPAHLSSERFPDAERIDRRPADGLDGLPLGPRAYPVVMTHSFAHDREWVRRLLGTDVPYIGLLGPRARGDEILHQIDAVATGRLFTPVGLRLGADGPEQVAVSIVAELLAVVTSSAPRHLRDEEGVIHAG